jgi:hypothetical protein
MIVMDKLQITSSKETSDISWRRWSSKQAALVLVYFPKSFAWSLRHQFWYEKDLQKGWVSRNTNRLRWSAEQLPAFLSVLDTMIAGAAPDHGLICESGIKGYPDIRIGAYQGSAVDFQISQPHPTPGLPGLPLPSAGIVLDHDTWILLSRELHRIEISESGCPISWPGFEEANLASGCIPLAVSLYAPRGVFNGS